MTLLKRSKEMKRQSSKHAKRNRDYARQRQNWLIGKRCAVCNRYWATEVHHIAGRNAKARDSVAAMYEDPRNWLPVCGAFYNDCHGRVDKESPALLACAAKMRRGELDIIFLRSLRPGRRFSFALSELHQALDDLEAML